MSCTPSKTLICSIAMVVFTLGCSATKPMYINDTGDLSFYLEQATEVEYPDAVYPSLDEVTQSYAPVTVLDPDFDSYEDVTLEDVVSKALLNSKVIRGYGTPGLQRTTVTPGQDNLTNSPLSAQTTFNVAIRETEPGFLGQPGQIASPSSLTTNTGLDSNQGVESALADFDAQLTSSLNWAQSDEPRNGSSILNNNVFVQDQATWQSQIAKKAANGTQIFFRNINQWTENNNPLTTDVPAGIQELDSWYRASFEAEIRQPLLRGRGTFINRMPIVISRIGTDQEIANLDASLQNMVTNIEIRYWDLYCAYRAFDAAKTGANAAVETFRIVQDQYDEGAEVNIQQLAQAKGQYHFFNRQVIDAYTNLLNAEGQLRFLLGWSATDGKILRPIDEPVASPIEFEWCESLCEALTYRPELRQERWEVKKRELALAYSKNGLLPELNVTMLYRWLGLGNRFGTSASSTDTFPAQNSAALNDLESGNFQEFQFGGTFAMPVGYRRELANVRNAQLKLAREMARIEDMELDVQKELSEAIRALAANLASMQESFNQWKNTVIEEEHFERLSDAGTETLDVALTAQRRRADAEIAFYTSLCEYNKTIALIHRRKGTILAYSGICFKEGPWAGKAYQDAQEHARRRGASRQINYGWTRPQVISRGPNFATNQNMGQPLTANNRPANPVNFSDQQIAPALDPYGQQITPIDGQMMETYPAETYPINSYPMDSNGGLVPTEPTAAPLYSPSMEPTPASPQLNGASNSRQQRQYNVQQVNYIEDAPAASPQPIKRGITPAAIERLKKQPATYVQPVAPKRDNGPMPTRRLQAKTPTKSAANVSTNQATPVRGNLNWEKLGLQRPAFKPDSTQAKIKLK